MATKKPIANANPDIPKALTASETAGEATPTATAKKSAAKTAVKAPARPTAKTSPPKPAATPVPAAAPALAAARADCPHAAHKYRPPASFKQIRYPVCAGAAATVAR